MRNHGILAVAFVIAVVSAFPAQAVIVPRDLKAVRVEPIPLTRVSETIGFDAPAEERETAEAMCRQAGGFYGEFEDPDGTLTVCVYD